MPAKCRCFKTLTLNTDKANSPPPASLNSDTVCNVLERQNFETPFPSAVDVECERSIPEQSLKS